MTALSEFEIFLHLFSDNSNLTFLSSEQGRERIVFVNIFIRIYTKFKKDSYSKIISKSIQIFALLLTPVLAISSGMLREHELSLLTQDSRGAGE